MAYKDLPERLWVSWGPAAGLYWLGSTDILDIMIFKPFFFFNDILLFI